jgi:hypothetical protein
MRVTGRLDLASPPEGSRLDAETQLFRLCVLTEPVSTYHSYSKKRRDSSGCLSRSSPPVHETSEEAARR